MQGYPKFFSNECTSFSGLYILFEPVSEVKGLAFGIRTERVTSRGRVCLFVYNANGLWT